MFTELKGKRLLILGGIGAMVEIVQRAQELGIEVLVTDYLADSPAKKFADKSFMVSTTDVDAVVELCRNEHVDGVFTGNIDSMLPYYSQICKRLNIPCYGTAEHFELMTDKKMFKDVCRKYDVPVIMEYPEINENTIKNISYPVIVKPIDSSGSRGISVCESENELKFGLKKALSYSPSKQYLVERYMTGDEAVLYYYFQDGNPVFAGMCDRYVNKEQQGVAQLPTAYIFPSKYTKSHLFETDDKIKEMFKNIKMENGSIFLQAFIENGIPYLYEPGYRLNGAREQYILSAVNDVNSADMLISFALSGKMSDVNIEEKCDPLLHGKYACKLSPLIRKGVVGNIVGIDKIQELDAVVKVVLNNNIGDKISDENIGTLRQIAYRAFIVEDSIEELKRTIDYIQKTVEYLDTDGNSMMLEMFDTDILLNDYK